VGKVAERWQFFETRLARVAVTGFEMILKRGEHVHLDLYSSSKIFILSSWNKNEATKSWP